MRNFRNKTYIIENVWDVISSLTFEGGVSACKKYCFQQKNQLIKLYKTVSVLNYIACIYSDFISVVTTFNFIFDSSIVLIYKVKLINK